MGQKVGHGVKMSKLTELKIKNLSEPGRYSDGNGLFFRIKGSKSRNWLYRFTINGNMREIGLGTYPSIPLKKARELANECRVDVANDIDPIEKRNEAKKKKCKLEAMTFEMAAFERHKIKQQEWSNGKHQQQWINTLKTYVFPYIGNKPLFKIEPSNIEKCLSPIWLEKKETAGRVRQRIEDVLDWAKVMGFRDGENPARLKGNLEHLLPKQKKIVKHQPALSYKELPVFWTCLQEIESNSADALRFLILTASRSNEVTGALWDEIDWQNSVWSIPAERMKMKRSHRIPLSQTSLDILLKRRALTNSPFIFEGQKLGKPMSNMTMNNLIKRKFPLLEIVPHGFRSSFRDWAENQSFSHRAIEYCLAHSVKDKTEAAYQRDDLLGKRHGIMKSWAEFIISEKNEIKTVIGKNFVRL